MQQEKEAWKHKRRSIEHDGVDEWVGWSDIMELYRKAQRLHEDDGKPYPLYLVVLFETGGRLREVLKLRPQQFSWNEECVRISRMPVLKRRKRVSRNVIIKWDPLSEALIQFVRECDTKYLLQGRHRFSGEVNPKEPISGTFVYNCITAIDADIWPHWLRDQRSWQLSAPLEEGGNAFDAYLLKDWFKWGSSDMPFHYAGRRGEKQIMKHLGISRLPKRDERLGG